MYSRDHTLHLGHADIKYQNQVLVLSPIYNLHIRPFKVLLSDLLSSTPVRSPLTLASQDARKLLRDNPTRLLARMQRIIPHEAIRATRARTVLARSITLIDDARDIQRQRPIQVRRRILIHIRHQSMDVEARNLDACARRLDSRAVRVHLVQRRDRLLHAVAGVGDVAAVSGEELRCVEAAGVRERVLGREVQGGEVQQDEGRGAVGVQRGDGAVHAVHVVCDCFAGELRVGQEGAVADVVGPDPDCVGRRVGRAGEEARAVWRRVVCVCEEGGELVACDVWKRGVDGGEGARGYLVGAYGA